MSLTSPGLYRPYPRFARIGLYDAYLSTLGGGENFLAVLAELLEEEYPDAEIEILTPGAYQVPVEALCQRFDVTLRRTEIREIPPSPRSYLARLHPLRRILHEKDIERVSGEYDLFVNNTIFSLAPARSATSLYMCMFPLDPRPLWMRGGRTVSPVLAPYSTMRRWLYRRWLGTYDRILANSEFTRGWIRRYWDLDASVLYPPIATAPTLDLRHKRNAILALGRFFPGDHNKKHDVLIAMIDRLRREGVSGWELHLAGGRTRVPGTDEYIARLRRHAEGLPVYFHFDASSEELRSLLSTCALFWHATGFEEDATERPEKLEHFGMSTVEAMTHGCVPVVFSCGGQPEIIEHGRSGFLWHSLDEFCEYAVRLARNPSLRTEMAVHAHERSQRFGREVFRSSVRSLLRGGAPTSSPRSA